MPREIPRTKASEPELWRFVWSAPEQTVEQTMETPSRPLWRHCNALRCVRADQMSRYMGDRNLYILRGKHYSDVTKEHDGVSNHQPHDCLLNCLFGRRSKESSKLCVTGLCAGNSSVTGEFPTQRVSNAEDASIWWHHHETTAVGVLVTLGGRAPAAIALALFFLNKSVSSLGGLNHSCSNLKRAGSESSWCNCVNIMAADALAPCVARPPTPMILTT